jgi:anaerobic magnesium-protoporphyrin IX monomethyl ester cyclase
MTVHNMFNVLSEGVVGRRPRDTSRPVMLIGFQHQGNLGLGYLAATLGQQGYRVVVFDFEKDPEEILSATRSNNPILIGFSLIFQFYIHQFGDLARYLRRHGVTCHFTMGGHFPSLSYQHTLELVPELDSVVRFEGELTLLELVEKLSACEDWRYVQGIAYRSDSQVIANPLRPLVSNLDLFPHPERDFQPETVLGHRAMPLVASRGCARTCSFCSIHTFYRAAPGKVVRTRQPVKVVEEMSQLYEERGITIFLFQDDDFPLFGPVWRRWTMEFLDHLHRSGLPGRAIWKINCRADAVDPELFCAMRDAGLYLVYMGLESGSEEGLDTLNKKITVEQNLRAVRILKEIGLMFEFGFMMFDPSSTFAAVEDNVNFLREIVGDGSAAAVFCRMLPYDGTPIKEELERAGRLRGDVCNPEYDFLDPRIEDLCNVLSRLVHVTGWIHGYRPLSPQLNWAWNEVAVLERLFPPLSGMTSYKHKLKAITKASNHLLFQVVQEVADACAAGGSVPWSEADITPRCQDFLRSLLDNRNDFVFRNQDVLLGALDPNKARPTGVARADQDSTSTAHSQIALP